MEILPINALVYNQEKVDIQEVIAPPYDVINEEYQNELYERSPYNITRLILPKGDKCYEEAKNTFEQWQKEDILIHTKKPSIFYIIQRYTNEKGKLIERKGFIARNRIEDFSTKKVLPHEYTMGGPKQDRLNLVSATDAFFSQIFMVYNDEKRTIEKRFKKKYSHKKPAIQVVDDNGVENIVYIIDDKKDIEIIAKTLEDKTLLIADGHHRYETAMNYSKLNPNNEDAKYVMSYFTNASDENLIIYPTHRIITKSISPHHILERVKEYYNIEILTDKEEFLAKIEEENKKQITTGLILKGDDNYYVLKLKFGKEIAVGIPKPLRILDLAVLHELVLKKGLGYTQEELMAQFGIKYEKQEKLAFDSVKDNASACFIMAYPKMQDIIDISNQDCRMPQKSTYFYPKLLSGIVINPLKQ